MKTKLQRWFWLHYNRLLMRLNDFQQDYDLCELCGAAPMDAICVSCDARICGDCESGYYRDAELCKRCAAEITPEQRAQDEAEYWADTCESGCHRKSCPCTRPHAVHDSVCRTCTCFGSEEPCDKNCAPSGYTGPTAYERMFPGEAFDPAKDRDRPTLNAAGKP